MSSWPRRREITDWDLKGKIKDNSMNSGTVWLSWSHSTTMQGAQGTCKDIVAMIYFFRRRHLSPGSIYSFELMKITLNSHLQRTFTNTRIGRSVMEVTGSVLLHLPSIHQRWRRSQQLCLLRRTQGFLSAFSVVGIKVSFQYCNSQISPTSLQCWQGNHYAHLTGKETVAQRGFPESPS